MREKGQLRMSADKISHKKREKNPKSGRFLKRAGEIPGAGGIYHHQDHFKPLPSAHPTPGTLSEPGWLLG